MKHWLSNPVENAALRVLSLGAGVQSTVMALMAEAGEIGPRPDCAIFADTQWEPQGVYDHLDWLESQLSFPVYRVSAGDIRRDLLGGSNTTGQKFSSMPFFTDGGGMGRRQCTKEYKIEPIRKKTRELLGVSKGKRVPKGVVVEQWIGISTDEMVRCKDNRDKWTVNRWPLIEAELSRVDCHTWWKDNVKSNRELAKSACIGCPYHDNKIWRDMRDNDPESWLQAVDFDKKIRNHSLKGGMDQPQFVHRSLKPLDEVDLSTAEDRGQMNWLDECDGMCGV